MNERLQNAAIESEAADWFLRLRESADPERSAAEFSEWLTRSPAHVDTYLQAEMVWSVLDLTAHGNWDREALIAAALAEPEADKVVSMPRSAPGFVGMRRRSVTRARRAAASAAAALVLAAGAWLGYSHLSAADGYRNDSAKVRRITLPDGSLILLSPDSEVYPRWSASERRLELRHGRARFEVTKDPQRPFLVDTSLSTVRAVGTVFDVDAQQQETHITVIEGRVAVESGDMQGLARGTRAAAVAQAQAAIVGPANANSSSTLQLSAGDRATISGSETARPIGSAPSVMAWTGQRVVFRGASLGAVVDEFNRYQGRPVVIADSALATLIISGVFDPKNPESLLSYLQLYENVQVNRTKGGGVQLFRRGEAQN